MKAGSCGKSFLFNSPAKCEQIQKDASRVRNLLFQARAVDSSGWPPKVGWWAQLAEDKISVPPFFYLEHKWTWVDRSHSPRVIHKEDDQDFHFHFHWNTFCGWVDCSLNNKGQESTNVYLGEEDVTPIFLSLHSTISLELKGRKGATWLVSCLDGITSLILLSGCIFI